MGSAEFGNGIRNAQRQVAATVLNSRAAAIAMDFVDTDKTPYDTGTFASTGTSVATLGVQRAAEALRENLLDLASQLSGVPVEQCRLDDGHVRCGDRSLSLQELHDAAPLPDKLHVSRKVYGSPRSTAFLAHGFRIAVHRVTGEIRILQSVQAFDAGKIINPMQAPGTARGRNRPGDRHDPLRADGDRRLGRGRESHLPELPHSGLRRHPPIRDFLRRHPRPLRSAGCQAAGRGPRHPRQPPPWVTRSPTRRAFASTACPSAPTGSFRDWPSCNKTRHTDMEHVCTWEKRMSSHRR